VVSPNTMITINLSLERGALTTQSILLASLFLVYILLVKL
jgi:hypothetical protein